MLLQDMVNCSNFLHLTFSKKKDSKWEKNKEVKHKTKQ